MKIFCCLEKKHHPLCFFVLLETSHYLRILLNNKIYCIGKKVSLNSGIFLTLENSEQYTIQKIFTRILTAAGAYVVFALHSHIVSAVQAWNCSKKETAVAVTVLKKVAQIQIKRIFLQAIYNMASPVVSLTSAFLFYGITMLGSYRCKQSCLMCILFVAI